MTGPQSFYTATASMEPDISLPGIATIFRGGAVSFGCCSTMPDTPTLSVGSTSKGLLKRENLKG